MDKNKLKRQYLKEKMKFNLAKANDEMVGNFMSFEDYVQACGYYYVEGEDEEKS